MKKILASLVAAAFLFATPLSALESEKTFVIKLKSAVGLLYSQDSSGTMNMRCTATIYEKTEVGYKFVSAAHCVGSDDTTKEHAADPSNIPFYITFDEVGSAKKFYPAKVKLVGYQHRGEDFSVFEVETKEVWPVVPLGDEQKEMVPAPYWNVASPLGLGKQTFDGNITSLDLDRPIIEGDINWQHSLVLQESGVNGGSSGSALVAKDQQAIVGFLVGTIGGSTIIAIPVSRFKAVLNAQAKGKYHWYHEPEKLEPPDGSK